MRLRGKIASGLLAVVLLGTAALVLVLGYDSDCPPPGKDIAGGVPAVVYHCYGSPDVLHLKAIEKPGPRGDEILVRVRVASVNPLDWHYMRGKPYFMRLISGLGAPDYSRLGTDFSGTVEALGPDVTRFRVGDEVFGGGYGAFAQYLTISESKAVALKPPNVSFEQAASVGIAGVTALQALRDIGTLQPGQKVLINGASGGVGTFAVQMAKAMGAEVTGVCSTRNIERVRSLGADHVIDYTRDSYLERDLAFDLIIDNVGNHSPLDNRSVLTPGGRLIMVGGPDGDWIGMAVGPIQALVASPFIDEQLGGMLASLNATDLAAIGDMMENGTVVPVIDRQYALHEVREAMAYSETGRARGKILLAIP